MKENEKRCSFCNDNYSLYKVPVNNDYKNICMACLKDELTLNSFGIHADDRLNFIKTLQTSIQQTDIKEVNAMATLDVSNATQETKNNDNLLVLKYGVDFTEKAAKKGFDPVYGRAQELNQLTRVLSRRMKNNPILVGEPGIGKTAIVEQLATMIVKNEVPDHLKGKRIVSLNTASLLAGTKYRGEFEDRMMNIINELKAHPEVILYLDEIHTINSNGSSDGTPSIGQLLKPALSRGEIKVIGTTTNDEYRLHIEKDAALERRFQKVKVAEPTVEQTVEILKTLQPVYEAHHGTTIPADVLQLAVTLSNKYVSDRRLPDKAIDLIDEACSYKRLQNAAIFALIGENKEKIKHLEAKQEALFLENDFEQSKELAIHKNLLIKKNEKENERLNKMLTLEQNDIAFVLNEWTGIPVQKLTLEDKEKIKNLKPILTKRVKGQEKAIDSLVKHTKMVQLGLKDENQPNGTFMMLGPTGVGKTELAKAYTEYLLGDESKMIRFDMSEFMDKHSVSRLVGTSPGYVGYEDEGELTKALRQDPYAVVLFDEMEKAHGDIANILLQLFDEGRITSGKGKVIDAKNATFIMTSNIGSDIYDKDKKSVGFTQNVANENEALDEQVRERLKKHYRPEFLNRIDDVLVFNKLSKEDMIDIADKLLLELEKLLAKQSISLSITEEAKALLIEKGHDEKLGARPLKRQVNSLKGLIAETILDEGTVSAVIINAKDKQFYIEPVTATNTENK